MMKTQYPIVSRKFDRMWTIDIIIAINIIKINLICLIVSTELWWRKIDRRDWSIN